MIALFVSHGCSSCRRIIKNLSEDWASQIIVLNVEFDKERKYYRVYQNGKPVGDEAPVETVPTLCFFDEEEVYRGYNSIIDRLTNGSK